MTLWGLPLSFLITKCCSYFQISCFKEENIFFSSALLKLNELNMIPELLTDIFFIRSEVFHTNNSRNFVFYGWWISFQLLFMCLFCKIFRLY